MRLLSLTTIAGLALLVAASFAQAGAAAGGPVALPAAGASPQATQPPDDADDSRVAVQLIVAGIAVGVVVVLGSGAYLLRRKLGLIPPPPDPDAAGRH